MKKTYLSQHISTIYICIMFILFPLIMHNKLFDIVETKRNWFVGFTISFTILCLLSALSTRQKIRLKPSLQDYFMLGFILINIFSYIFTSRKDIALYGTEGRAFGLFTIIFIGISYFLITRFCTINKYIFTGIMFGSSIVSVNGILNFFGIDPFGIYTHMASYQTDFYIATLGHTNIYSSFFSLTLPIGIVLYIKSINNKTQLFYLITSLISFIGLVVGNSDSGYITIGVILLTIPLLLKSHIELVRLCFFLICGIILSRLIGIMYVLMECERVIDSLTSILLMSNYILPIAIILLIFMLFIIIQIKQKYF